MFFFQMANIAFIAIICIVFLIQPLVTFYIPGVAPLDFKKGEDVEVKVNIIYLFKSKILNILLRLLK